MIFFTLFSSIKPIKKIDIRTNSAIKCKFRVARYLSNEESKKAYLKQKKLKIVWEIV
jgi:hypothetical protein